MVDDNCIFCKIAAGTIPSKKVYEDEDFYAFHDIHPAAPVHVLVIPRKHIETLSSCTHNDADLIGKMMLSIPRIAAQLGVDYTGGETGYRAIFNVGPGGGQEIYHLHAHILAGPRPWTRMA